MKFSIITPTFKRPGTLTRAVESVLSQTGIQCEVLVINDNPMDGAAKTIQDFNDSRIKYFENEVNSGVNFSRNVGLNNIAYDSDYIIFLDDDDYLAADALSILNKKLEVEPYLWLMTARGIGLERSLTKAPSGIDTFSYAWDYLITKKIKGDATHCISSDLINGNIATLRFPAKIKQAEEWLFYFELGTHSKIHYEQLMTTLTDGYSDNGLNLRKRAVKEQLGTLSKIFSEARVRNLTSKITFWIYFAMRFVRSFIK